MWKKIKSKLWVLGLSLSLTIGAFGLASNYDQSVRNVLISEGGSLYTNHPADPGGPTKYGITRRMLSRYRGTPQSIPDVKALTEDQAKIIYKVYFWDAVDADTLDLGLDYTVFDYAVNSGQRRALLACIQCMTDSLNTEDRIRCVNLKRLSFAMNLPSSLDIFKRGWRRRILSVERISLAMAQQKPGSYISGMDAKDMIPRLGLHKAYDGTETEE